MPFREPDQECLEQTQKCEGCTWQRDVEWRKCVPRTCDGPYGRSKIIEFLRVQAYLKYLIREAEETRDRRREVEDMAQTIKR